MKNKSYLDSVERKAYRTFFKDGTLDMFFGLFLIGVGANSLRLKLGIDTSNVITLSVLLLIPAFILTRIFITGPRFGYVKFGPARKKRKALALLVAIIAQVAFGILFLTAFYGPAENTIFQKMINPFTEFIFIVLIFNLLAYLIDFNRFYLIGLAAGTGLFLADLLTNRTASILTVSFSFGSVGLFLLLFGLIQFLRFLKEYPKQDVTVNYEK